MADDEHGLTLHLADGTRRERTVTGTPGDPDRPLSESAMRDKFRRSTAPILGERWAALWEMARHPDRLGRTAALIDACRP